MCHLSRRREAGLSHISLSTKKNPEKQLSVCEYIQSVAAHAFQFIPSVRVNLHVWRLEPRSAGGEVADKKKQ